MYRSAANRFCWGVLRAQYSTVSSASALTSQTDPAYFITHTILNSFFGLSAPYRERRCDTITHWQKGITEKDRKGRTRRGCTKTHYTCYYNRTGGDQRSLLLWSFLVPARPYGKERYYGLLSGVVRESDIATPRILNCENMWSCMIWYINSTVDK